MALYTCQTILKATGLMHGPDKPPVIVDNSGRLFSALIAIPNKVFINETESAPAPSTPVGRLTPFGDSVGQLRIEAIGN